MQPIVEHLLNDPEPMIRRALRVSVLGEARTSPAVAALAEEIRHCPRVQVFLDQRDEAGRLPGHPYDKWTGAHWTLALLAEWGYPCGDLNLIPLREQVLEWLLGSQHSRNIRDVNGRTRRCASQEGYALLALLRLGLADERCDELAKRMMRWQWQDGGWNCDRRPDVTLSSYHETWLPLRALNQYALTTGNSDAKKAVERGSELLLARRLVFKLRDGTPISSDMMQLRYPRYWRYDLLGALKTMTELGRIQDARCQDALDYLQSRQLPNGGFAAEHRVYSVTNRDVSGRSAVSWGSVGKTMNPWVTVEALAVLKAAGRWQV